MRTIGCLPPKKRRRIAIETLEIFAPIANRLGMHAFRVEFEDLGFAALYPMRYRIFKEAVSKARGNRQEIMELIDTEMRKALKNANTPNWKIIGREKHLYSIYKKMHDKHLSFSEIMDVYGFRVIVDKVDTCYRVLGVLHNLYKPLRNVSKITSPFPKPMVINHCIPLYLALMACRLKFKSARKKCIKWRKMVLPRTGFIKLKNPYLTMHKCARKNG